MSKFNETQVKLFSIDGNIGAGKTTVIKKLKQQFKNIVIFVEPIEEWEPIITAANENPKNYAFKAQDTILNHFEKVKEWIYNKTIKSPSIIIVERSALTSLLIFTKNYVEQGVITEKQLQHLEQRVNKIKIKYNKRILINTDVANCFDHIKIRQRNFELKNLKIKDLKKLDKFYKEMYEKLLHTEKVTVNGNQTKLEVFNDVANIIGTTNNEQRNKTIKK